MKKLTSVLLFISFFSVITFSSCKNLFSSEDFLKTLNKAIEYSNAEYVTVTIDAPNSYTDSVSPSAGIHATEYKCGDTFTLSFVPGADFYFTK